MTDVEMKGLMYYLSFIINAMNYKLGILCFWLDSPSKDINIIYKAISFSRGID